MDDDFDDKAGVTTTIEDLPDDDHDGRLIDNDKDDGASVKTTITKMKQV